MVDFTREEVEDIVDKLEKADLGGGNLCHAGQRGKYVDWCIFTPEFFSVSRAEQGQCTGKLAAHKCLW